MNIALIIIAVLGCFVSTIIGIIFGYILASGAFEKTVEERLDKLLEDRGIRNALDKLSRD